MKNRFLLFLLLLATAATAQNKMLTIEDAVMKQRSTLAPKRLDQLNWIKGSDQYYYIQKEGDESWLMTGTPGKTPAAKLLSLSDLFSAAKAIRTVKPLELKSFPLITWISKDAFRFTAIDLDFTYTVSTKKMIAGETESTLERKDASDASGYIAYTKDNNLFIRKNGADVQVTNESNPAIVCGQSVHRDEFGISKGTFWSPGGKLLAFYRMDQTMVTDYPVLDLTKQPAQADMIKYPMAGGKSHEVTVGIYNAETGKTVYIQTGEPKEQYLTNIAWSPDEKSIYIVVLNRDQNHLWLNRYNASTGAFEKTLFEETDDKYVHPMHPMLFVPTKPNLFVWQSERKTKDNPLGLNTLYLYDTNGMLQRQLTNTTDVTCTGCTPGTLVTDVYGFDATGTMLYFQVTVRGPDRAVLSVDITKKGKRASPDWLTRTDGVHSAVFNSSMTAFIDHHSSITLPREQSIVSSKGKELNVLLVAENPLKDYKACKISIDRIKAADGSTDLWYRMILPADFDSTKKYPALVYVYNGPGVQLVTDSWLGGADMFLYYMAQQGYVVFTVDGRGSQGRGIRFEQTSFQNLGTNEIDDQEKGVEFLKSRRYVDANRMAVYGWSFGGFMTTSLMTRKPGMFRAGVAGGPVIDWSYYEVMYTERYMDTPQSNKAGYDKANLLNYVDKLQGKLLLIHGTSDDVVVWQHSLLYLQKAVEKGVQLDYFVYPGHLHNVMGHDRVHLTQKIADYIIANTK